MIWLWWLGACLVLGVIEAVAVLRGAGPADLREVAAKLEPVYMQAKR